VNLAINCRKIQSGTTLKLDTSAFKVKTDKTVDLYHWTIPFSNWDWFTHDEDIGTVSYSHAYKEIKELLLELCPVLKELTKNCSIDTAIAKLFRRVSVDEDLKLNALEQVLVE
jgi:hypothetical protein